MDTSSPLVANLQAAVQADGRTPRAISLAAGVRHDTIRNITTGRSRRPGAETLAALARELRTTPDALLGREPPPAPVRWDAVEVLEYDLSPHPDGVADPRARQPVSAWRIPRELLPADGDCVLVRSPVRVRVSVGGEILEGQRLLVDMSPAGRIPAPYGRTFLVFDGGVHAIAAAFPRKGGRGKDAWELRMRDYPDSTSDGVEVVGRLIGAWNTADLGK
jgi:transcriptional regulator with XRE-family HTH domain